MSSNDLADRSRAGRIGGKTTQTNMNCLGQPKLLNTPRLVADASQTTVWRWDQAEPFGTNAANEDPDGNAVAFDLPLRLPGQHYDKETALHYNYFRDYDPSVGRYAESDPIGLRGGLNTYSYVAAGPLDLSDAAGLLVKPRWPWNNWYGNWCGPGGGGAPIDCVDRACKRHDDCYRDCSVDYLKRWIPPGLTNSCAAKCDAELYDDYKKCQPGTCK